MDRAEKREFVTGLNEVFKSTGSVVVAHYAGLTVANMNELRSKMRAAGGTVKVAKNRLAVIAPPTDSTPRPRDAAPASMTFVSSSSTRGFAPV